jgi:hypothetical protein
LARRWRFLLAAGLTPKPPNSLTSGWHLAKVFGYHSCIRGKKGGSVSKGKLQRLKNFAHAKALSLKGFGRSAVDDSCIRGKKGGWRLALAFGVAGWRGWTGNGFAPMALFWTHKIRPMPRASALGY